MRKQRNSVLFHIYSLISTIGFLCSFFAFILPFWYGRYPGSKNRFVRLGLWEICLEDFMTKSTNQQVFNGCFHLLDWQLRELRRFIIKPWLYVAQTFFTISFLGYIIQQWIILSQTFELISIRGPRGSVTSFILLSGITVCSLTTLIVMGVGVSVEHTVAKDGTAKTAWLSHLEQNSLSWCYGLAAFSLLAAIFALSILTWFVYPRKKPGGLLSKTAWSWPHASELPCCRRVGSRNHTVTRAPISASRLQAVSAAERNSTSHRTRSLISSSGVSRITDDGFSCRLGSEHTRPPPGWSDGCNPSATQLSARLSYDPRSSDAASVRRKLATRPARTACRGTVVSLLSRATSAASSEQQSSMRNGSGRSDRRKRYSSNVRQHNPIWTPSTKSEVLSGPHSARSTGSVISELTDRGFETGSLYGRPQIAKPMIRGNRSRRQRSEDIMVHRPLEALTEPLDSRSCSSIGDSLNQPSLVSSNKPVEATVQIARPMKRK